MRSAFATSVRTAVRPPVTTALSATSAGRALVLTDASPGALVSTATDVAREAAAHAVDLASAVTTETVVRTVYKAPVASLVFSFLLGGLFFSLFFSTVAAIIALGKENTRRLWEVLGIVCRRNWSVLKLSMQVTMVSCG